MVGAQIREFLHHTTGSCRRAHSSPSSGSPRSSTSTAPSTEIQPTPGELLDALGLREKRSAYYKSLSGGQKQRLSLALALVGQPKIAILDEMTTGLDPQARRDTWELIEGVRDRGVTVVLVTHYMDEAERLCDRVALIDQGRVVAIDSPAALAEQAGGGKRVRFVPSQPFDDRLLTELPEVTSLERQGHHVLVNGTGDLVNAVILTLATAGVTASDVEVQSGDAGGRLRQAHRSASPRRRRRGCEMSATEEVLAARPPRAAFGKLLACEARLAWREPIGLVFGLAIPVVLLVVFGAIPSAHKHRRNSAASPSSRSTSRS